MATLNEINPVWLRTPAAPYTAAMIEERPIDARSFSMRMTLKHPLFGELFRYSGRFTVPEETNEAAPTA